MRVIVVDRLTHVKEVVDDGDLIVDLPRPLAKLFEKAVRRRHSHRFETGQGEANLRKYLAMGSLRLSRICSRNRLKSKATSVVGLCSADGRDESLGAGEGTGVALVDPLPAMAVKTPPVRCCFGVPSGELELDGTLRKALANEENIGVRLPSALPPSSAGGLGCGARSVGEVLVSPVSFATAAVTVGGVDEEGE